MKFLNYFVGLAMVFLFFSCGDNPENKLENNDSSLVEKVKTGNNVVQGARQLAAESEALKKLTPIPVETLKAHFPESIFGLPKTNSDGMDMAGLSTAFATYGHLTNHQINMQVIDGAGEKGAAATGAFRAIKYDQINKENNGDYNKIKEYEGTIVREDFDKVQNRYTLTFFYNDRFAVKLKITGFEQKEVWDIFKESKLQDLKT